MTSSERTINAAGKSLGRVAAEAAKALMGKMRADYTPNKLSDVKVTITGVSKLVVRQRKLTQKVFQNYSGYPGGRRDETLGNLNKRKGHAAAVRLAITRMLPRNTFRVARLKNLTIEE
jgi:large subunit ribosomal protein L13